MLLLDSNVISELRRSENADRIVVACASAIPAARFFLSAISILKIEFGAPGLIQPRVECIESSGSIDGSWCRLRGLNSRPSVYKTAALPLS
jgi:hypothetical protein